MKKYSPAGVGFTKIICQPSSPSLPVSLCTFCPSVPLWWVGSPEPASPSLSPAYSDFLVFICLNQSSWICLAWTRFCSGQEYRWGVCPDWAVHSSWERGEESNCQRLVWVFFTLYQVWLSYQCVFTYVCVCVCNNSYGGQWFKMADVWHVPAVCGGHHDRSSAQRQET